MNTSAAHFVRLAVACLAMLISPTLLRAHNTIVLDPPASGVDAGPAIRQAADSLAVGGVLTLTPGTYVTKTPLDLSGKELHIEGEGAHLVASLAGDGTVLTVGAKPGQGMGNTVHGSIRGLTIEGGAPFWWDGGRKYTGLLARNCVCWRFEHLSVTSCFMGIECRGEGKGTWSHKNVFDQCDINHAETCFRASSSWDKDRAWNNNSDVRGGNWSLESTGLGADYDGRFIDLAAHDIDGWTFRDMCMQIPGPGKFAATPWWFRGLGQRIVFSPGWMEVSSGLKLIIRNDPSDQIDWQRINNNWPWAWRAP